MTKPYIHGMLPDTSERMPSAQAPAPEIRFLGDMQRLQPQPGDVFVLTCEGRMSAEMADRTKAELSGVLGGAKVIVLDGGLKLGVVAAAAPAPVSVHVHNTVGDIATPAMILDALRSGRPTVSFT